LPIVTQQWQAAHYQVGTLGGGNHFLELQADQQDNVWVMIHSGSRNVGKKVADEYNKQACDLNRRWRSCVPKEWELAFLPLDSKEGQNYLQEMAWCIEFARCNRALMMQRIDEVFQSLFTGAYLDTVNQRDISHNYAKMENHFGANVMVHRKGATFAGENNIGIIPGSQGTKSYIVRGLGNPDSFNSSSHGAGRKMGRNEAEAKLDLAGEIKRMDDQGIIHGIRHQTDLDEAPGAYKSIEDVMAAQADLVDTLVELRPLAVLKGD
jgi:tRNA-splicing ligase RtcB